MESLINNIEIATLKIDDLQLLTKLFDYNDIAEMLQQNATLLSGQEISIFGLFCNKAIIGELRVKYKDCDPRFAVPQKRAYLYAFRILPQFQGKGWGQYLLKNVLKMVAAKGYSECTVGVEDQNAKARHLYAKFGFNKKIATIKEEYQGDKYSFDLMLKQ